jgi:hypothetical protein
MGRYILEGVIVQFNQKTHGGRIYDEQIYSKEFTKWKIKSRKWKIERILKEI